MNFFFDNNLPPQLARALNELSKPHDTVVPLRDKFPQSTPDAEWVSSLRDEGNWVVISIDHFRKNELEKMAFRESGLAVFCLHKQWASKPSWDKYQNMVRWWPAIQDQAKLITGGAAFEVPWRFGTGKFKLIKI